MSSKPTLPLPLEQDRWYRSTPRSWLIAVFVHVVLLTRFGVIFSSDAADPSRMPPPLMTASIPDDDGLAMPAVPVEAEDIPEDELAVEAPLLRREELDDHAETDNDLPVNEDFGRVRGMSDALFEAPAHNGTIGLGRGRGAFGDRGTQRARRGNRARGGTTKTANTRDRRTTWRRSPLQGNAMRLKLGSGATLPLHALEVRATVEGFRARVILECDYQHDQARDNIEGTFQWRLPDGATPYYLAFGTLGKRLPAVARAGDPLATDLASLRRGSHASSAQLKEARIVPRTKAAHAYTQTVRRRIDPALMEWAGGGVFQSRVFPLRAGRLHRITVGYEVNLEPRGDELVFDLHLPATDADVTAQIAIRGPQTPDHGTMWTTRSYRNPESSPVRVRVPRSGAVALRSQARAGVRAFAAQLTPALPPATPASSTRPAVLVVDTSTSSGGSFDTWQHLIRALLTENRDTIEEFAVVFFNVEAYTWRSGFTPNTPDAVDALLETAGQTVLEGASDLDTALRVAAGHGGGFDTFLLSDGACNWGERDPALLGTHLRGGPLYAYRGIASGADGRTLNGLARATGGAVFTVGEDADLSVVARAHRTPAWKLQDVRIDGVADVLVHGRPEHLMAGQHLVVAGRGEPRPGATIDLVLARGDETLVLETPIVSIQESELADSTYGQIAVESLEAQGPVVADTARAYALHYRVVGKTCSLLMLESERDYQRLQVEPEKDSEIVQLTRVRELLARGAREHGSALLDPKARFLAWVDRVSKERRVTLLSADMHRWIEALPTVVFSPRSERLVCRQRGRAATAPQGESALEALAATRAQVFGPADALRLYSTLIERSPGDLQVACGVAFAARALGLPGQARHLFERALRARPLDPVGYLAVARCLAEAGNLRLAACYYEMALVGDRGGIAATHYLGFLRRHGAALEMPFRATRAADMEKIVGFDRADLLVTLTWNTDRTDVDLHVRCPNGETCSYQQKRIAMGGSMTDDVRTGHGPEMFVLSQAADGSYEVLSKMYLSDNRRIGTRTRVLVTVTENWGTNKERVRHEQLLLGDRNTLAPVTTLKWVGGKVVATR